MMANKTKLQYPNQKQYIITIPKSLVLAKGWKKGNILEFTINNHGEIVLRKNK